VQRVGKKSRTELDEALAELADLKNKAVSGAHAAADEKLTEVEAGAYTRPRFSST
jgi:hypothetical protein